MTPEGVFSSAKAGTFTVLAAEEGGELVGYSVVHALSARGYIMALEALAAQLIESQEA